MRNSKSLSIAPTKQATILGWAYLVFQLIFLPSALSWLNGRLATPLAEAELNFLFFAVNFVAVTMIFRDYLRRSAAQARHHFAIFVQAVILGFVAYYACAWCVDKALNWVAPGFTNVNDTSIAALSRGNYFLMAIGTVILVPPVEECFYRGLVFRNLYSVSRVGAYLASMALFAFIHVAGYIGSATPLELVICFLQYLPAGLCLAWSYTKSDTIFVPIVIHALVNARGIYLLR